MQKQQHSVEANYFIFLCFARKLLLSEPPCVFFPPSDPLTQMFFCLLNSEIHPDGLPHAYTIIMMFRFLPDSPTEAFDIWQVSTKDHKPETGVTVDRKHRPGL